MAPMTLKGRALPLRLATDLRRRLALAEWSAGDQLPTEAEVGQTYGVSRSTVRQALAMLEAQGLIEVRHGRGSFVSDVADSSVIRAGLQELQSISSTIAEMGRTPRMLYHHRLLRKATAAEQERFGLPEGEEVLDIQRRIQADGVTVAYSYDILPRWAFPRTFRPHDLNGSVFNFLDSHSGPRPKRAVSRVHAVSSPDVAWGDAAADDSLFVLLDQLHFDEQERPFMHTKSYFVEGRFNFTVIRMSRS